MRKTLILSYANWDSLIELPYVIKNGGGGVVVYCKKGAWAIENNYYDEWIEAPDGEIAYLDKLFQVMRERGNEFDWVIPGDDEILRLLNEHIQSEDLFKKLLPITKIENRAMLGTKSGFSDVCIKCNIPTPKYLVYTTGMSDEHISSYMGFPLIIKLDKSQAGTGVFICHNNTEFNAVWSGITDRENCVFQQFIKGFEVKMEALYDDGKLIAHTYSRILKVLGKNGLSTQRLFINYPEIRTMLEEMGEKFGLNGFGNIAFMVDEKSGKHYLIEADLRPNSWVFYGKFNGVDFSEAVRRKLNKEHKLVKNTMAVHSTVRVSLYKKDMMRAIVEKDTESLLYWFFNKENSSRFKPNYDPKLLKSTNEYLWWYFKDLAKNKIAKILKK